MSAREVPRFPEDDPKHLNVRNWPAKRRMGAWSCELKVRRVDHDPTTTAEYLCRPWWWPWGKPQRRGPSYRWAADGHLLERSYERSPGDVVFYQMDRSGRLVRFTDRKQGVTEYFDANGVLVAGEYEPVNLDWRSEGYRGGTVSVWLGDRVTHAEFVRRVAPLLDSRAKD